jgi:hypothetical protein
MQLHQTRSAVIKQLILPIPPIPGIFDISKNHRCLRQVPALPSGSNANDFIYLIELAISEICTNIIQHAMPVKEEK